MENLTPAQATVISSALGGLVAIIVCFINNRAQQKKMMREMMAELQNQYNEMRNNEAVRDAKLQMWMQGVEEKLGTHNSYAEKLEGIQKDMGEIQTDIAVIKNDIKTLYKQA